MADEMIESPWQNFASLAISAQGLAIVDPMSWDSVKVELEPGVYDIWIRTIHGGERVSRVRVSRAGGGIATGVIEQVGTDVATLMFLDAKALSQEMAEEVASFEEQLGEGLAKWRNYRHREVAIG